MPLEENPYIAPHFKALISCQKFGGLQRCGRTLSLWNALLKISILLHKMASGYKVLSLAVHTYASSICLDKKYFVLDKIQIVQDKSFVQS